MNEPLLEYVQSNHEQFIEHQFLTQYQLNQAKNDETLDNQPNPVLQNIQTFRPKNIEEKAHDETLNMSNEMINLGQSMVHFDLAKPNLSQSQIFPPQSQSNDVTETYDFNQILQNDNVLELPKFDACAELVLDIRVMEIDTWYDEDDVFVDAGEEEEEELPSLKKPKQESPSKMNLSEGMKLIQTFRPYQQVEYNNFDAENPIDGLK